MDKTKVLEDFEVYASLSTKKRLEGMSQSHKVNMKRFLGRCLDHIGTGKISRSNIIRFISSQEVGIATKALMAISLSAFFFKMEYIKAEDVKAIQSSFRRKAPTWSSSKLSKEMVEKMMTIGSTGFENITDYRHKAMLALFIITGARPSQLSDLKMDHVKIDKDVVEIYLKRKKNIESKGPDYTYLRIPADFKIAGGTIRKYLLDYLRRREFIDAPEDYFFITRNGNQMLRNSLQAFFRSLSERINLNVNPRMLRHFVGTEIAATTGIAAAAAVLGHSHISTTQQYVCPEQMDTVSIFERRRS